MMEETKEYCYQDDVNLISFARGGPIFVSNHVGPLTSVPDFKASLLQELQELEAELLSADGFGEELSIDDLKVFTEEELVEKALKEEFEPVLWDDDSLQIVVHANSSNGKGMNDPCKTDKDNVCSRISENESSNLESSTLLNASSIVIHGTDISEKKVQQKKSKKRGRLFDRNTRAAELESNYFEQVKKLAKIKQRQDEDKLAAALHSFSGNSKSLEGAITTLDKIQKMHSLRLMNSSVKVKSLNSNVHIPVCYPEVVLCVEIYSLRSISKKIQEFLVLGSQYLTELRDNIYCLTDKLMQTADKHDTSGYFLIEDTFCNDLRSPSATDYSKPIFYWLENHSNEVAEKWEFLVSGELKKKQKKLLGGNLDISKLSNFKAVQMHKIRFCDLRFRLGAGYLYCHQGNCNHIIVIRDMRLIHPEDSQTMADYPLCTFQVRARHQKCSVCQIYRAEKMTIDDKWAQKNPCYFCIKCYFLLHYKEDNTLLYPHTVYDYHHE